VGLIGESLGERLALALGVVPRPLLETMLPMLFARTVLVGNQVGVFEALADGPHSAAELAEALDLDPEVVPRLLDALVSTAYLRRRGGRYALARVARRWLVAGRHDSVRDNLLLRLHEWDWLSGYENYVRTGRGTSLHGREDDEFWCRYQRGMRAIAASAAAEVAARLPVPKGATAMLDIGGSHGLYSVRLCQRHPGLRATILDLPNAVRHAAPLLAQEGMGDRVVHCAGDALTEDLGEAAYDLVFVASLVHHFDDATNRTLACRIARALRSGGVMVVLEPLRPESPERAGQIGSLLDLFFAFTSSSGTWSLAEIQDWQRAAGLHVERPVHLRRLPNMVAVVARKAAGR
jgi:SAM-dependent methyltransferase